MTSSSRVSTQVVVLDGLSLPLEQLRQLIGDDFAPRPSGRHAVNRLAQLVDLQQVLGIDLRMKQPQ